MVKVVEELYGKTIGAIECPTCQQETPLRVNRNGTVWYRCNAFTGIEVKGRNKAGRLIKERCYERHYYSRRGSKEILNEFLNEQQLQEGLKNGVEKQDKILKDEPRATTAAETGTGGNNVEPARARAGGIIEWLTT